MKRLLLLLGVVLFIGASANGLLAQAKWTFMVYLAGDNDLESAAIMDFNEMEAVGSTDSVQVVVQFDRVPGHDVTNGNWEDTRRYRVLKDSDANTITSPVLQNLGEVNMGDPQALVDFINWALQNYPAQHYCLVLWDHGGGWRSSRTKSEGKLHRINALLSPGLGSLSDRIQTNRSVSAVNKPNFRNPFSSGWGRSKDVCYDDTDGDHLTNDEIATALQSVGVKMDIVGYDACLMAMLENAYEIRNLADYMVGSEEREPGYGWAYDLILTPLVANPDMNAATFSQTIVDKYEEFYTGGLGNDQTQSAMDLSKISDVLSGVNVFAEAVISDNSSWTQVDSAWTATDNYNENQYLDLFDFASQLRARVSSSAIQNAATNLMNAISAFVIRNYTESAHAQAHGVAVYFPPSTAFDPRYTAATTQLDFPVDSQWDEFLSAFYKSNTQQTAFDPYEPNDNYDQAYGLLESGQAYEGYITSPTDLDIFKVVTGSTFNIIVDLTVPADFDLLVTQRSAAVIDTLGISAAYGTTAEHLELTEQEAGTYYILILPYQTSFSPYQLLVNIVGGEGSVEYMLSYDDGDPEYGIYSTETTFSEGVACYFRSPIVPAKLVTLWYFIYEIDVVPGDGDDGSFYTFATDYYGALLPDSIRYVTPGGEGWNFVDLSTDDINLYGDFFAGMFWDAHNTPAIGWDTTMTNGLNLIYTSVEDVEDWYLGDGTYFIRAEVSFINPATGVEETAFLTPERYELRQNFPNPFNPATIIHYELPRDEKVQLRIFNLLGKEVATLVDKRQLAGRYEVQWNGRDKHGQPVASGVYFYQITAGDFKKTQHMLLLK